MFPTAESDITKAEEYLAATIAASARWQQLCAVNGALASVYFDELPAPPDNAPAYTAEQIAALRPYAVIFSDENTGHTFDHQSTGPQGWGYQHSGVLGGYFEVAIDPQQAHDMATVLRQIKNDLGVVLREMRALSGQAGYLGISRITTKGPIRCHEDAAVGEGDFVQLLFTIEWGRR